MIKLLINLSLFLFISSCQTQEQINKQSSILNNNANKEIETFKIINYVVGDPYYIEGVLYKPAENYNYNEVGLATYYGKELHNKKTINNDLNKVTDLLARHKTLPLPSIVKITNLENGLSLILKINDRHEDNSSLIQVSRKSAQLLKFYKEKIARVKIEIISDPSKQMKLVTQSMSEPDFTSTVSSAPTELVSISNIEDEPDTNNNNYGITQPIEIGYEDVDINELFLKIYDFRSYEEIKSLISALNLSYKFSTNKEENYYSLIIGPLKNIEANNLVLSFISKGYKKTEFILK